MVIEELFAALGLETDESSFEKGQELIEGVHTALEALAVYEGVKKLHEMVDETVEAAVGFKRLGERLGINAQEVQELGYAADVSGASVESMQVAMQHLAVQMEEAKKSGTGPLVDALHHLHVSFSDPAFQKGNLDDKLMRIADAFADAGPEVNKTGLAMQIFGRSGTELIPLLNKGADGIAELRAEFQQTGAELDDHAIESLEKFEEAEKKLKYTATGLRNEFVEALLPTLQSMVDGITAWVHANRELIKQRIEQIAHALIIVFEALARVVEILVMGFTKAAEVLDIVVDTFEKLVGGASGVEDILVDAAYAVGAAWALANLPLLGMIAVIAAVILVVQDLWNWINGGDSVLKHLYDAFVNYLGETGVGKVILGVMAAIHAIGTAIEEQVEKLIKLGHRLGSALAWNKRFNEHYDALVEGNAIDPKTGMPLTREQLHEQAAAMADYDDEQREAQELANKRGQGGYGTKGGPIAVPTTGALDRSAPFFAQPTITSNDLPGINAPVPVTVHSAPHIEVHTTNADPHAIATAIDQHLEAHTTNLVNQTAHAVGATRGGNTP